MTNRVKMDRMGFDLRLIVFAKASRSLTPIVDVVALFLDLVRLK